MHNTVKSQNRATAHCRRLVRSLSPFDRLFNFKGTLFIEDGRTHEGHLKWKFGLAHLRYVSRADVEYILNVSEANDVNEYEVRVLRHALEWLDKGGTDWATIFSVKSRGYSLNKLRQAWNTVQLTSRRAASRANLDVFQFPDSIVSLLRPDVEQQECNKQFAVRLKSRKIKWYPTRAQAEAFVEGFTAALRYQPSHIAIEET